MKDILEALVGTLPSDSEDPDIVPRKDGTAVSTEYGRGIDNGRYPTPRTVLFGLSVS